MTDNYSHLLSLLSKGKKSDEGKTAKEIHEELGIDIKRVRGLLSQAFNAGMLTIGKRQTLSLDQKRIAVPVYSVRRDWSAANNRRDVCEVWIEPKDNNKTKKKRKNTLHCNTRASPF